MTVNLTLNNQPPLRYLLSLLFSTKLRIGITVILSILCIAITAIYIQDKNKNDYKDPIKIGRYFAYALITRDKEYAEESMLYSSDETIHSKIKSMDFQEFYPTDVTLTNYKRINNYIVETYSLVEQDLKKAWHASIILKPVSKPTWKEIIANYQIFDKNIFAFIYPTDTLGHPIIEERWLVTDFYIEDKLNIDEYNKLMEDNLNNIRTQISDTNYLSNFEEEYKREVDFLDRYFGNEIIKQNTETKNIYNLFFQAVYLR